MTGPVLVYLAHRVGAPDRAGVEAHLGAFRRWLAYLVDLPDPACRRIAWCAPWLAYAESLIDGLVRYRERGLRDAGAALDRCSGLVLVGKLSTDRQHAHDRAVALGLPIVDFTAMGELPPVTSTPNWWAQRDSREVLGQLGALVREIDRRAAAARSVPA